MLVILLTVVSQSFTVTIESRGSFDWKMWTINGGIFQAIGVISFGMSPSFQVSLFAPDVSRHYQIFGPTINQEKRKREYGQS
jgi:hypothetical protein